MTLTAPDNWYFYVGRAVANGAATTHLAGPRWFVSGQAEAADPNGGLGNWGCTNSAAAFCDRIPTGLLAGAITGYDIFPVLAYNTQTSRLRSLESVASTTRRVADIEITWGAAGALTSVNDLTHHVAVPFGTGVGPTWGFLNPASFANVTASSGGGPMASAKKPPPSGAST